MTKRVMSHDKRVNQKIRQKTAPGREWLSLIHYDALFKSQNFSDHSVTIILPLAVIISP